MPRSAELPVLTGGRDLAEHVLLIVGDLVFVESQRDQFGHPRQRRDVGDFVVGEVQGECFTRPAIDILS